MVSAAVKEHQVICVERKCTDVWIFEARCLKYFSKKKRSPVLHNILSHTDFMLVQFFKLAHLQTGLVSLATHTLQV